MGYGPKDVIIAVVGSQFLYKGLWLGHAIVLQALSPLLADFPLREDNSSAHLQIIVQSGELTNNYSATLEVDDRVNGYIFPKDNRRVLTQILLEVISKGKISPLALKIASIGRNTAKNLYVLAAIEGYASLLQNILRLASQVAAPKAVSEISPNLKEQWQWHLFEAASYVTYQNRTRSNAFLHKYEQQWSHSQRNRSIITVAANDSFLYSFWEEEKYIQLTNTRRRRREEEELKDRTEHSHGTRQEVYQNAKRALKLKRELPGRDEELERTGQPLCI